jgi:hypothetical protein
MSKSKLSILSAWFKLVNKKGSIAKYTMAHYIFWQGLSDFKIDPYNQNQPWFQETRIDF